VKSWKAKEWEAMRLAAPIDAQLYMRNRQQCDDSLPKKRGAFSVSTTHAIRTWDRGAKKFESLKDLMYKVNQFDRHNHLPKV
jgi:hypothetical protein